MNNVIFVKEAFSRERAHRRGGTQRIIEEATAYKDRVVLDARGEGNVYKRLLPELKAAPDLLKKERLYIQTMEKSWQKYGRKSF